MGLGIYLPTSTTLMVVVGAVGGWFQPARRSGRQAEATRQLGVLLASGLIVGESLLGVVFAAVIAFSGAAPIALVGASFDTVRYLGRRPRIRCGELPCCIAAWRAPSRSHPAPRRRARRYFALTARLPMNQCPIQLTIQTVIAVSSAALKLSR